MYLKLDTLPFRWQIANKKKNLLCFVQGLLNFILFSLCIRDSDDDQNNNDNLHSKHNLSALCNPHDCMRQVLLSALFTDEEIRFRET